MRTKWTSVMTASVLIATAGALYYRNAFRHTGDISVTPLERQTLRDDANSPNAANYECHPTKDENGILQDLDNIEGLLVLFSGNKVQIQTYQSDVRDHRAAATGTQYQAKRKSTQQQDAKRGVVRYQGFGNFLDEEDSVTMIADKGLADGTALKGKVRLQAKGEDFAEGVYACAPADQQ